MSITPHIVVQSAERAAGFYRDAFGADEVSRIPVPDGRLMSVQLRIGDGLLHLADEFPEMGVLAPPSIGGTPWRWLSTSLTPRPCLRRRWRRAQRSVNRWRTCSGATVTASSRIRSGIAGTSLSMYATCHMMRSLPPPHRPSPERVTNRGGTSGQRARGSSWGNDLARLRHADARRTVVKRCTTDRPAHDLASMPFGSDFSAQTPRLGIRRATGLIVFL